MKGKATELGVPADSNRGPITTAKSTNGCMNASGRPPEQHSVGAGFIAESLKGKKNRGCKIRIRLQDQPEETQNQDCIVAAVVSSSSEQGIDPL